LSTTAGFMTRTGGGTTVLSRGRAIVHGAAR
jgi:hypothetical protein